MQLRYAQLEELLAGLLDVHPARRKTLGSRIRLFRLKAFPPLEPGASGRLTYDLDSILRLGLAFQMLEAFIPQETVPAVIEGAWPALEKAFQEAFALINEIGDEAAALNGERHVALLQPRNLHAFSREQGQESGPQDLIELTVTTASAAARGVARHANTHDFAPLLVIDLHRLAAWLRNAILQTRWAGPELFERPSSQVRE